MCMLGTGMKADGIVYTHAMMADTAWHSVYLCNDAIHRNHHVSLCEHQLANPPCAFSAYAQPFLVYIQHAHSVLILF